MTHIAGADLKNSSGLKKIDVSGYPTDPKFLLPTLKILS
jgi:hypothetical protein